MQLKESWLYQTTISLPGRPLQKKNKNKKKPYQLLFAEFTVGETIEVFLEGFVLVTY